MVDSVLEVKQIKQLSADGGATVLDVQNQTIAVDSITDAAGTGAPNFPNGVNGLGQLIGISYSTTAPSSTGNWVTLENSKIYHLIISAYDTTVNANRSEYWTASVNGSGVVTLTQIVNLTANIGVNKSDSPALCQVATASNTGIAIMLVFEQGTIFDNS